MQASAQEVIRRLELKPHPEGGWYRETWRAPGEGGSRGAGTAIFYLLERHQRSHWHRIDATELWLHHAGGALRLRTAKAGQVTERRLGPDFLAGELLQAVVEPGEWQSADTEADWTLVCCVVAPAFEFAGFEMAPEHWEPDQAISKDPAADVPRPSG